MLGGFQYPRLQTFLWLWFSTKAVSQLPFSNLSGLHVPCEPSKMLKQRAKYFLDKYTPQVHTLARAFTVCQHDTIADMSDAVAGKWTRRGEGGLALLFRTLPKGIFTVFALVRLASANTKNYA